MYTPFLVSALNSGISRYLRPWLQTDDAFTDMQDCYTYRGVVQKRYGFSLYGCFVDKVGIKQVGVGNGVLTTFSPTLTYTPVGKKSLTITHTQGGSTYTDGTDDGAGAITGTNIAAGSTVDYVTGAITLNFTAAPTINTPIRINYGVKVAANTGGAPSVGPYTLSFPTTGSFGTPLTPKSIFIKNTASAQFSSTSGDVPNDAATSGTLVNGTGIATGSITDYSLATNQGTVTFVGTVDNAAANQDIWGTWQFTPADNPIKGIKFYWQTAGLQQTLVFNNKRMAVLDPSSFAINDVTGSDFFNTADANFFSVANYNGKAYILNNSDRLTLWDGTNLYQPIISFTNSTPTVNELTTGLHVFIYKNRIVVLRPTENSVVKPQRARYSSSRNTLDWVSNSPGHGGFIDAPTPEWIVSAEFLRDELIVNFQDSTWKLRYTGVDTAPFRWEKINDTRRNDCPYTAVSFQNFTTSLGSTGLIRCDGVNVERYDDKIIDYTQDNIDQDSIQVSAGYRFDYLNQQFLCHPSPDHVVTDYSDKWLVWSFLENSFSVWNIDATTIGTYIQGRDLTWGDFTAKNNLDFSWNDIADTSTWMSYFSQGNTKIVLFGTKEGCLYALQPGLGTDNGTKTGFSFLTKDFNPFVKDGQQARLGYVDFYFDRPQSEQDPDPNYNLTIDFFINESEIPYKSIILNPSSDNWKYKRVYSGAMGNFHRFKVYLSDDQIQTSSVANLGFILSGYILYMAPGGRLIT